MQFQAIALYLPKLIKIRENLTKL